MCVMAVWRLVPCMFVTPVFVPRYFPSRPGSCRWTIQYFQSDESAPADMYAVFVMEIHYSDVLSKLETGTLVCKSFTDGWFDYSGVSGTKSIMAAVTCKIWLHN